MTAHNDCHPVNRRLESRIKVADFMGRSEETVKGVKGYNGWSEKKFKGWGEDFFGRAGEVVS
jgi:hypothetical protein